MVVAAAFPVWALSVTGVALVLAVTPAGALVRLAELPASRLLLVAGLIAAATGTAALGRRLLHLDRQL